MSVQSTFSRPWIHTHLGPLLRFGSAGLLLPPGASKFVTHEQSVRFFRDLGIPSPEVLVVVVGALELTAATLFIVNRMPWLAALIVAPIMLVAAITAGPSWQNVGVFGAALVLVAFEALAIQTSA